ncbi:hypothetical protein [Salinimicrobium sp. TH3]|uniref:hypothetical protein n=1 Tax=Salinimicrobium sp. TH3 TaxID=2997342 RepID=UPI0022735D62|nr:hypothetical protein [Salinimicrobium sp. TH3]MCY2687572.1 hypothetical protein [Salinimicrobium sp. TH3]
MKEAVEQKYKDNQVKKAAFSLIALHLIKFQMKLSGNDTFPLQKRKIPGINSCEQTDSPKLRGVHRNWQKVKEESVPEIAERFGIPLPVFLDGLEKLGFEQGLETIFEFKEFKKVYAFIKEASRKQQLQNRKLKKERKSAQTPKDGMPKKYRRAGTGTIPEKKIGIKTHKNSRSLSFGVFDKIRGAGGLGKVIYTRM